MYCKNEPVVEKLLVAVPHISFHLKAFLWSGPKFLF